MASSSVRFSDDERPLQALLEAFGSFCSLEEIASAYCRSKGDLLAAGDILCKVQDSKSLGSANEQREKISQGLANEQNGHKSQGPADEQSLKIGISEQETKTCEISTGMHIKMSKSKKATASVGTVSRILGNSYNKPSYSVKEKSEKAKPIKIEVPKSVIDALDVGSSLSGFQGSKKESLSNREIEQFLFSMLGDGFKLSMDVIREVLGSCGYDIHKSMEELLDFSTVSLGKGKAIDDTDTAREYKQCTGSSSQEVSISVENTNSLESNSRCTKSNLKDNFDISQQVLQSLFTVPERVTDEPFKPRFDLGVNRPTIGSVVSKPLQEVKMPMPVNDVLRHQLDMNTVPDEDDEYKNLRDATKQHWDLMKEYYEAAITAFTNGDHQHQNYLMEQGKHYFKLAREFEEKSARHAAGSTQNEDEEMPLDLRSIDDSKNALYLLKMHICKLVNIPNLQYLKVIVGPESKDAKKTKIKRKVIHLLEKESIQWTETEADPGTISIRLDQIDHSKLSFAKKFKDIQVQVEGQDEISQAYKISDIPYFVFYKDGNIVETLGVANPSSLANKVASIAGYTNSAGPAAPASLGMAAGPTVIEKVQEMSKEQGSSSDIQKPTPGHDLSSDLATRVKQLINSHPVFLFMKGSPEKTNCMFSKKVVEILQEEGVAFGSFDVLTDDEIREAVKLYANWPAYPQLFCNGSLIGGSDIVVALHENGELSNVFKDQGFDGSGSGIGMADSITGMNDKLMSQLKCLVNAKPVMVFLEGKNDQPKGYSETSIIEILGEERAPFETFDVLVDEEVKEGLKMLSNWSAYPQVYVKGQFIGGSDIVSEMHKSGELKRLLSENGTIMSN